VAGAEIPAGAPRTRVPPLPPGALGPRCWGRWAALGVVSAAGRLPYRARVAVGRRLGRVLGRLLGRRRRIAAANLALCFPELDEAARERLLGEHLEALGVAFLEMAAAWCAPERRVGPLLAVEGEHHLERALAAGRGALLVSAHFLSMEMGMRLMAARRFGCGVYRPHNDPLIDHFIQRGRARYRGALLERSDVRGMVRALRANLYVWYAPDQDHGPRHSVFAPFFGIPAATLTATSRLARLSGAPVLPLYTRRLPGTEGYVIRIGAALEAFPSGDEVADATRLNALLEAEIRAQPAEYLWVHRRFKTRPPGAAPLYGPGEAKR